VVGRFWGRRRDHMQAVFDAEMHFAKDDACILPSINLSVENLEKDSYDGSSRPQFNTFHRTCTDGEVIKVTVGLRFGGKLVWSLVALLLCCSSGVSSLPHLSAFAYNALRLPG
jgi:hypothetical protein